MLSDFATAERPLHATELRGLLICPWSVAARCIEADEQVAPAPATAEELAAAAAVQLPTIAQEVEPQSKPKSLITRTKERR